jgi:hypothetical protein
MSISFHGEGLETVHCGFRFNIRDLPKPYRVPIRFREFLFENRVPGYVVDEFEFQAMTRRFPQECLSRVWSVASQEAVDQVCMEVPRREDWYSFNPDDFEDCHNCVTWAVSQINQVVSQELLTRPRQGRIKEIVKLFLELTS